MKTTMLYLIIAIKTISLYLLIALIMAIVFSSCQPDEVAPLQTAGSVPLAGNKVPTPVPASIPPDEVIRTDYAGATKWRITFNTPQAFPFDSYQRYFSTLEGSFYTKAELNSSAKATERADLNFMPFFLSAPSRHSLHHAEYAKTPHFAPAEISAIELADITAHNPDQFQILFEHSTYAPTEFQPYKYHQDGDESEPYSTGEIYLFKLDQNPVRYGAARIVENHWGHGQTGPLIIEIIVQAYNNVIRLP